jgi:hypothetical protein
MLCALIVFHIVSAAVTSDSTTLPGRPMETPRMSKPGAALAHADGDARTRVRWSSRRPFRRIAAILTSLALGAGLAVVGVAAPASAHHNTITPSAICDTDGTPSIEWTVTNSESKKDETIIASSDESIVKVGTEIKKGKSETFTQADVEPGTYTLKLTAEWSNDAKSTDDASITITEEQCETVPTVKKITFCHATHSEKNPFVKLTTSVNAFFRSGHDKHQDLEDIYPAFSYIKHGKTYTVEARGDQSLLQYKDCVRPPTPVKEIPVPTATFFDECGVGGYKATYDATLEGVEWIETVADGKLTLTAKPAAGYAFTSGNAIETIGDWTLIDTPCPVEPSEPSLEGSAATGICEADSPWISYDVKLTDPENTVKARTASLVMTDGTNTETIVLGDLKADGTLTGKALWPGASVDADGTANGWPGWALVGDKWIEVDDNFAWTRGDITAKLVVNPEVPVTISYPNASPDCAGPKSTPGGQGGSPVASNGTGLASTGFAGTTIAIVAGVIVIAGVAFLVVARIRRKRA